MIINRRICLLLASLPIILLLIVNAPKKEKEILWLSLQKETNLYDSMEYNNDIAENLRKNQRIDNKIPSIPENIDFYNKSLHYLKKVYNQNTATKENSALEILGGSQITKISLHYNLTGKNNTFDIKLYYKSKACIINDSFFGIGKSKLHYITEYFTEYAANCLTNYMEARQSTDFVFVGTDHALSILTLKTAKKFKSTSKIGLFVFDEHVDIYDLEDYNNLVTKANIFGKMLLEGYVDYVTFFGASDIAKNIVETSVSENFTKRQIFN